MQVNTREFLLLYFCERSCKRLKLSLDMFSLRFNQIALFLFRSRKKVFPASNNNFPGKTGSFKCDAKMSTYCGFADGPDKRGIIVTPYFTPSLVTASHEIFRSLFIRSGLLLYTMSYG